MGVEQSDTFIILKPKSEWRTAQTESGLIEAYKEALDQSVPGITQSWAQPIEMRMDDLLQGVMADLAIVIHGTDTATLHDLAVQARVVSAVPGAAGPRPSGIWLRYSRYEARRQTGAPRS
jgi:cobalt-zinc-cadmium resistance protein CzcA